MSAPARRCACAPHTFIRTFVHDHDVGRLVHAQGGNPLGRLAQRLKDCDDRSDPVSTAGVRLFARYVRHIRRFNMTARGAHHWTPATNSTRRGWCQPSTTLVCRDRPRSSGASRCEGHARAVGQWAPSAPPGRPIVVPTLPLMHSTSGPGSASVKRPRRLGRRFATGCGSCWRSRSSSCSQICVHRSTPRPRMAHGEMAFFHECGGLSPRQGPHV